MEHWNKVCRYELEFAVCRTQRSWCECEVMSRNSRVTANDVQSLKTWHRQNDVKHCHSKSHNVRTHMQRAWRQKTKADWLTSTSFRYTRKRSDKLKTKIFYIDEVRDILKLSESAGKKKKEHFEEWEEFFKIYCRWYPKNSLRCKYTVNNKNNVKNYVFLETKEQAILARILFDFFSNRPTFISENLKIGETHDLGLWCVHFPMI